MSTYHKFYLAGIVCLFAFRAAAQLAPLVPYMWVSAQESAKRENRFGVGVFNNNGAPGKQAILTNTIGKLHPACYNYPLTSFQQLIGNIKANGSAVKGVRVYIVAYDKNKPAIGVKMGRIVDKQIVLVFAGSKGCRDTVVGSYYIIDPVDHQVKPVAPDVIKDWENYYVANYIASSGGLVNTLEPTRPENQMPKGGYSDTRSIFYCLDDFTDWFIKEPTYQATKNVMIDHIRAEFAAYDDAGDPHNPGKFKDRLLVMYEFVSDQEVVYIEDTDGYLQRNHKTTPACLCQTGQLFGSDNGQLCPPNCPCPTGCN
jgi:hypothetical protein